MSSEDVGEFEYRCDRCGQSHFEGCTSVQNARTILTAISMGDWTWQKTFHGGQMVTAKNTHLCNGGGMGLSRLVGYRIKAAR
jgi:hypothetical protein